MFSFCLGVFCLSRLINLSCSSAVERERAESILDPRVLFGRAPVGLAGVDEQDRTLALQRAISDGRDTASFIADLLHGLNEMQDPCVSESVAELVAGTLEKECARRLPGLCIEELDQALGPEDGATSLKFMYDMRLLSNSSIMRCCLLRSFYRVVRQVGSVQWKQYVLGRHLRTVFVGNESREGKVVRTIIFCAILESAHSVDFLAALGRELCVVLNSVFKSCADSTATLSYTHPDVAFYFKMFEVYWALKPPLASKVARLLSGIDWKQVFRLYKVPSGDLDISQIPGPVFLSLPIDSEDPDLKETFKRFDAVAIAQVLRRHILEYVWHNGKEPLMDIRPGVKRYINCLWSRGKSCDSQGFAMAVCHLYDMEEWRGEAGWRVDRELSPGSGGLTGTDQVTVFDRLPSDVLRTIGPVMPVLVSKATYRLRELRASYSSIYYFVPRILRPFDKDIVRKLLHLHHGWAVGLSRGEIARARELIALSNADWIDRLWRVARFEEDECMTLARQGRLGRGRVKLGYMATPPGAGAFLVLSLVFGTAPFALLDSSERSDLLLIVKSQYPRFVLLIQALESLSRNERDRLSRARALADAVGGGQDTFEVMFQEWLLTKYLSEPELLELTRTCDMEGQFWKNILGALKRACAGSMVSLGAARRCASIFKRGLLGDGIDSARTMVMAAMLGFPKNVAHEVLRGDPAVLSEILPSVEVGAEMGKSQGVEGDFSKAQSPAESWIHSVDSFYLRQCWFVLLNLSDDEIVTILSTKTRALHKDAERVLSLCLSASAKSKIIAGAAKEPSSHSQGVLEAVLASQSCVCDGWEPEWAVFDEGLAEDRRRKEFSGAIDVGICSTLTRHYLALGSLAGTQRFCSNLFASLRPRLSSFARNMYGMYPSLDAVLPMLLRGRGIKSIGRNLYMLAERDIDKVGKILSSSLVEQKYADKIMAAVVDLAKGPGKAMNVGDLAQQCRFIKHFDFAAAEQDFALAAKAFRGILESLCMPASEDGEQIFAVMIKYSDKSVFELVMVPRVHELPPVYLFRQILKVVKEPFELTTEVAGLHTAKTVGGLMLSDLITVRVSSKASDIVKQLKVIFQLIEQQ